jgi:hypothetical protein
MRKRATTVTLRPATKRLAAQSNGAADHFGG